MAKIHGRDIPFDPSPSSGTKFMTPEQIALEATALHAERVPLEWILKPRLPLQLLKGDGDPQTAALVATLERLTTLDGYDRRLIVGEMAKRVAVLVLSEVKMPDFGLTDDELGRAVLVNILERISPGGRIPVDLQISAPVLVRLRTRNFRNFMKTKRAQKVVDRELVFDPDPPTIPQIIAASSHRAEMLRARKPRSCLPDLDTAQLRFQLGWQILAVSAARGHAASDPQMPSAVRNRLRTEECLLPLKGAGPVARLTCVFSANNLVQAIVEVPRCEAVIDKMSDVGGEFWHAVFDGTVGQSIDLFKPGRWLQHFLWSYNHLEIRRRLG